MFRRSRGNSCFVVERLRTSFVCHALESCSFWLLEIVQTSGDFDIHYLGEPEIHQKKERKKKPLCCRVSVDCL